MQDNPHTSTNPESNSHRTVSVRLKNELYGGTDWRVNPTPVKVFSNTHNRLVDASIYSVWVNDDGAIYFDVAYEDSKIRKNVTREELEEWNSASFQLQLEEGFDDHWNLVERGIAEQVQKSKRNIAERIKTLFWGD